MTLSKSCMDLMMFSSCSQGIREADWKKKKKKSLSETRRETLNHKWGHSEAKRGSEERDTQRDQNWGRDRPP